VERKKEKTRQKIGIFRHFEETSSHKNDVIVSQSKVLAKVGFVAIFPAESMAVDEDGLPRSIRG
jgi:hypothetical protein